MSGPPPGWKEHSPSSGPDYSHLMDNSKREGTYKMRSAEGHFLQIPYSKVDVAAQSGLEIDPGDKDRYEKDFNFAKEDPHKWGHRITGLLPVAGGLAGGMVGAGAGAAALGVGAVPGGIGGAAAGGAIGKGAEDLINDILFGDKPKSAGQEIGDIAKEGALQGVYEATGLGIAKAAGKGLGWAGETLAKSGFAEKPVAQAVLKKLPASVRRLVPTAVEDWAAPVSTPTTKLPSPIRMMPSEARGTEPGIVEKFVRESIFAKPVMSTFRAAQEKESQAAIKALSDKISTFTGSKEDLGKLVKDAIDTHVENFRARQTQLYNAIDTTAQSNNLTASMKPMKQFAKDELGRIEREEASGGRTQLQPLRQMLQEIVDADDKVGFQAIRDRRSSLLALARSEDIPLAGRRAGLAKKLAGLADQSMEDSAKSLDATVPGFSTRVRRANALTRGMHERFETDLVKKVIGAQTPENIGNIISKPVTKAGDAPFSVPATRALFKMLNPQDAAAVQRRIITNFMEGALKNKPQFYEKAFAKRILDIGAERGRIIFGKNWQNVKDLSDALSHIGGHEGLGSGGGLRNAAAITKLLEVTAAGAGAVAGYHKEGVTGTAKNLLWEAVPITALAMVLTKPALTIRVLSALRAANVAGRAGTPVAVSLYNSAEAERRRQAQARTLDEDQTDAAPDTATPPEEQETLPQLQAEAAERNPAAQRFQKTYTNHTTGHRIGTNDDISYFDLETGEQVQ